MDRFTDPETEKVTFMASSQIGKTTILENIVGMFCHYDPSPTLLVFPRVEDAEDFSKDRLSSMIRDTEVLTDVFGSAKAKDGNNTLLHKKFAGGFIKLAGGNSPAGLAGRSIRILLVDEVDRLPVSASDEGDPVSLAIKRTNNFHNRKLGFFSTPTKKNMSRIESLYESSDKRRYHVTCPHCSELIVLSFQNLRWENDDPLTTLYICQKCSAIIDESLKMKLLLEGRWIAEKPFKGHAGFHINELYSPWVRWSKIVADFLEARGNPVRLKTFFNTCLGESFEETGDAPEWRKLYEKREPYEIGKIPKGGLLLTGSADIQKDRIEVEAKSWGRFKENWSIDYRVLIGDTTRDEVWEKLREFINESFPHASGQNVHFNMFCIDSGYQTQRVYDFVRAFGNPNVRAIKGNGPQSVILSPPKAVDITSGGRTIKRGVKVWGIGTDLIKSELYGLLNLNKPTEGELLATEGRFPSGYCHFPEYSEDFFKGLTAEALVTKTVRGFPRHEWVKQFERNEPLDLHVYNRAAAAMLRIDQFKEQNWVNLEQAFVFDEEKPDKTQAQPQQQEKKPKPSTTIGQQTTGRTRIKNSGSGFFG